MQAKCNNCESTNITIKNWSLRNDFKLGQCNACGFTFTEPRPTLEYLINFYNSISNSRFYRHTDAEAMRASSEIDSLIKKYNPSAKKVLEIGCSTGYYLHGLCQHGYEVTGTELSTDAVLLAKDWYNVNVFNDEFPPDSFQNHFDVIIIYHVIEHVIDAPAFLRRADQFLVSGGIMILETPNFKSVGVSLFKAHYPVLSPPGHLNFFNINTLERAMPANYSSVFRRTTSNGNHTVYNMIVGATSLLNVKALLNRLISRKVRIKDTSTKKEITTNKKFVYSRALLATTKFVQITLFPFFYLFDKSGKGENLGLISKKQ